MSHQVLVPTVFLTASLSLLLEGVSSFFISCLIDVTTRVKVLEVEEEEGAGGGGEVREASTSTGLVEEGSTAAA